MYIKLKHRIIRLMMLCFCKYKIHISYHNRSKRELNYVNIWTRNQPTKGTLETKAAQKEKIYRRKEMKIKDPFTLGKHFLFPFSKFFVDFTYYY
jgi:hypothetical protein